MYIVYRTRLGYNSILNYPVVVYFVDILNMLTIVLQGILNKHKHVHSSVICFHVSSAPAGRELSEFFIVWIWHILVHFDGGLPPNINGLPRECLHANTRLTAIPVIYVSVSIAVLTL